MQRGGQASVETIAIMGISLIILIVFFALASNLLSDLNVKQNSDDAKKTVQELARAADSVYAQGKGASEIVTVILPSGTVFGATKTYIGSPGTPSGPQSTISINIGNSDIFRITKAPLSGSFPPAPGTYQMRVVSKGSYVEISRHLFEASTHSLYFSMSSSEQKNQTVKMRMASNETVIVDATLAWPHGEVARALSDSSVNVGMDGGELVVSFTTSGSEEGAYPSNLTLSGTGQSGAQEIYEIPVTVLVNG